jgi:hypothetical protein
MTIKKKASETSTGCVSQGALCRRAGDTDVNGVMAVSLTLAGYRMQVIVAFAAGH